jgi:hypothetical protein
VILYVKCRFFSVAHGFQLDNGVTSPGVYFKQTPSQPNPTIKIECVSWNLEVATTWQYTYVSKVDSSFCLLPRYFWALRVTSHMSQGPWPCNCEGLRLSSKSRTNCLTNMVCWNVCQTYLLELELTQIPTNQ